VNLVYLKETEQFSERVDDETAQLSGHQRRDTGEEFTHELRGVVLMGRHQVLPQLLLVNEQLGTHWNPPMQRRHQLLLLLLL